MWNDCIHIDHFGRQALDFCLFGFHKAFEGDFDWYLNASLANRNPNPSEFFSDGLHHSTGVIELGDLALEKEQSLKIATTVQKKWSAFSIEVNPYLSTIENYMFLKPVGFETTIRGTFPVWEYQRHYFRNRLSNPLEN